MCALPLPIWYYTEHLDSKHNHTIVLRKMEVLPSRHSAKIKLTLTEGKNVEEANALLPLSCGDATAGVFGFGKMNIQSQQTLT